MVASWQVLEEGSGGCCFLRLVGSRESTVGKSFEKAGSLSLVHGVHGTLQGTNISTKKWHFEDDFPFPNVGYVNSLEGILLAFYIQLIWIAFSFGRAGGGTCLGFFKDLTLWHDFHSIFVRLSGVIVLPAMFSKMSEYLR